MSDISQKYIFNVSDLKKHHIFGIFCTLIAIILIVPKISSFFKKKYYNKKYNKDKLDQYNRSENIFLMVGLLFLVFGLKEIFFYESSDTEVMLSKLIFYLRETNLLDSNTYEKLKSFNNESVLNYLK